MKDTIINLLTNIHEAKTDMEINDLLNLKSVEDYKLVHDTLEELVAEFKVFKTKKDKYILLNNCPNLKIGRLSLNKKGYGFVILDKEEDLYISKENINNAIHDDYVLAEITKRGIKREGKIIKTLRRDIDSLVGEVIVENDVYKIELDDEKKDIDIVIEDDSLNNCVSGSKVVVKLLKEIAKKKYVGTILKVIGHKDDPGVDILSIAYKYNIYEDFGSEVAEELNSIPTEVDPKDLVNRKDLTKEMIFTIDGDHTKDIDDAISLTFDGKIYHLGVHIADVSHYVKENTALGDEAYNRGTSSYLADRVIPMLPHKLSNGICSLNEGVVRLTMSCTMDIDSTGKVTNYDIFPSYIKSSKKMTYPKVNDILMRNIIDPEYEPFADTLKQMNELAKILRKRKIERGYIEFEIDEAEVIQDEQGVAIGIEKRFREDGEKLIEDFMIIANETVATHISNMQLPFIYRVHAEPNQDKIDDFVNLVKQLGYHINGKINGLSPKAMQDLLKQLEDKKEFKILSSMLLRSMKKAEYSKENIGHFGLASQNYTHFTSPIRRFPDLTVHRLLKKYLVEKDFSMSTINYLEENLPQIAEHSSEREVASVNAERDVVDMKMAEYMEKHIGEEYNGIISTVTNFGFFVELDNLVEGLVHVNNLKGDYYTYVPELLSLIGKSTKKVYRIGDEVRIRVINASKEAALIDFELVEEKNNGDKK